jgi:AcrR family transcriptional regulator
MNKRPKPLISARKKPRQARSTELVDAILEAAVRVLVRGGGLRFTTVRVAEEAGVSVGSLYQYFPNKAALLFRLQADEWDETWSVLEEILGDSGAPPRDRLHRAVLTFFRSERQEAALRQALDDAGALFRDAPEARALVARATTRMRAFVDEAIPGAPREKRRLAGDLLMTSMGAIGEKITEQGRSRAEVDAWARECAEMYWGYLEGIGASPRARRA